MFWIRTAFKELITHKGFSLFFILNLALGWPGLSLFSLSGSPWTATWMTTLKKFSLPTWC